MTPENTRQLEKELYALELKEPKDALDLEEIKLLQAELDNQHIPA